MGIKPLALALVLAALPLLAGCYVEGTGPGYGGGYAGVGVETYYYYPDYEVYYYPHSHEYWWYEGREWRHGARAPERFVLRDRERVELRMDHPPVNDHARIREQYPAHRAELRDRDRDRDDRGAGEYGQPPPRRY